MVSICVTIVSIYVLLNAEDYRWQWISFLGSGSTAFYVFLYSIYYYFAKTNMTGMFLCSTITTIVGRRRMMVVVIPPHNMIEPRNYQYTHPIMYCVN